VGGFVAYQVVMFLVTTATSIATAATAAFGTALEFATGPIGIIVLAIGALILIGIELYKHWDTVKQYASDAWNAIEQYIVGPLTTAYNAIIGFGKDILGAITGAFGAVKDFFVQWWPTILEVFIGFIAFPAGAIGVLIYRFHDDIFAAFKKTWDDITGGVKTFARDVVGFFTSLPGDVASGFQFGLARHRALLLRHLGWSETDVKTLKTDIVTFFTNLRASCPGPSRLPGPPSTTCSAASGTVSGVASPRFVMTWSISSRACPRR